MSEDEKLFIDFPAVSTQQWEEIIKKDLKGDDYKTKLNWQTGEGIEALPFYRKEDLDEFSGPSLKANNNWEIRQPIVEQNINKANTIAREAMAGGADALEFKLEPVQTEGSLGSNLQGIALQDQDAFRTLVDGIDLTNTALHFDATLASPIVLAMLHNACENKNIDSSAVRGSVLFNPYAFFITNGQLPKDEAVPVDEAHQMVDFCQTHLPSVKCLGIDARIYHNAGATIVQELGYALATGSEYLATLSEAGLDTDTICSAVHFNFSVGSNYFLEIAKFRAARKLWRRILDAFEADNTHQAYLHAASSAWNKTIYDPYVNMLRTTTEGMSAAIAGCDSISLHSFDKTFTQPDKFSRRIARNSQIILKEEAYFNKVADPAAGSYYIETLTDKIAREAWSLFQEVEEKGGMREAIKIEHIQKAIEESRNQKDQTIARRGRIFVGINQYPNTGDRAAEDKNTGEPSVALKESDTNVALDFNKLMSSLKNVLQNGASLEDILPLLFDFDVHQTQSIQPYRGPQAFEALRQATEHHSATPNVLTLPMGNKKMRKARSAFAVNFFGCAGYDIEDSIGFDSVEKALSEIKKRQPDIIVLCSSDEEYQKLVPALCEQLKELDEQPIIVLAGYPKGYINEYKKAGINEFIHAKCNVLKTLKDFQQKLGVIEN